MVNWAWILVALLFGSFVGYVLCAIGMTVVEKENKPKIEQIGYAKGVKDINDNVVNKLIDIQRTVSRIEREVNGNQLGNVSGNGDVRNGD